MNPNQLNILLLALGALQGMFLVLLLHKKRKTLPGYPFLAAYLLVMLMQMMMKLAGKIWLMNTMRPFYSFSYFLPLLYGPLIWLFIKHWTGNARSGKWDYLHFSPVIAAITVIVLNSFSLPVPSLLYPLVDPNSLMDLQLVSILFYHSLAWIDLKKRRKNLSPSLFGIAEAKFSWLRKFMLSSTIVCSTIAVLICFMYHRYPYWQSLRFGFVGLTIFIYWVSYNTWNQPEIFSVISGGVDLQGPKTQSRFSIHPVVRKYSNSGLRKEELIQIISRLEIKFLEEKTYLDPELSIDALANSISCTRHHLSQAMNECLGRSFYDYVNSHRVEEAKQLLNDPKRDIEKISSIGYDAGFNSVSTFNEVFKKLTGCSPTEFRKQREENFSRKQRV
ncbi:MAG: helix-turn-helix domain-containing protein [Chitinophagales bacterium]